MRNHASPAPRRLNEKHELDRCQCADLHELGCPEEVIQTCGGERQNRRQSERDHVPSQSVRRG
jgi:hypothetical protein